MKVLYMTTHAGVNQCQTMTCYKPYCNMAAESPNSAARRDSRCSATVGKTRLLGNGCAQNTRTFRSGVFYVVRAGVI
jgi:hypothetical protein